MKNVKNGVRLFTLEGDLSEHCITEVSNHVWINVKVQTNMVWTRVRALVQSQLAIQAKLSADR